MKTRRARRVLGDASVPKDLLDLFAAERDRPEGVAPSREDRVWGRVGATIGFFPPGGGGSPGGGPSGDGGRGGGVSGGGDAPHGGASAIGDVSATSTGGLAIGPTTAASLGAETSAAAAGGATLGATTWLATTTAKIAVGAALSIAAVTGVAVSRTSPPAPAVASSVVLEPHPVEPSVVAPAPPAVAVPSLPRERVPDAISPNAIPPDAQRDEGPVSSASAAPSARAKAKDLELAEERDLLESARAALSGGDATGAMTLLARHAAEHPRGRLGDEREALWVRALMASGRRVEARARFEAFRARVPESLFVPVMEAALGGS